MSEPDSTTQNTPGGSKGMWLMAGGAYVLLSAFVMFSLYGRIQQLEVGLATSDEQQAKLAQRLDAGEASMQATVSGVSEKLGTAQQELETRSAQLQRQHKASLNRLVKEQKAQMEAVNGEVAGVKTEVGTVKTDVEATKSDLAATKDKLEHTIGDLGMQSGLIAHTREDLEALRRKG